MEQAVQNFLDKMEKRMNSADPERRKKCVRELVRNMELDDVYIVEGIECLVKLLNDDDPEVRMETLKATEAIVTTVMRKLEKDKQFLVKYGGNMVPLRKLLFYKAIKRTDDPDPAIRLTAVKIAGEKSLKYEMIREKAAPYLVARIRDTKKGVRNEAISYVIKITIKSPTLMSPFLKKLLRKKRKGTDIYVAYVLEKVLNKRPMPEFIPILFAKLDDTDAPTEEHVIAALVKCGLRNMDDLKPHLVKGLTDQSYSLWWLIARNMMLIISKIAEKKPMVTKKYLRYILPLLTDESWEVRREAAKTVGAIGGGEMNSVKEALPKLIDLTRDPDETVKEAAENSLRSLGISKADMEKVRRASRTLNQTRLKIIEIKNFEALTDRVRNLYIRGRKEFSNGNFDKSYQYSREALDAARTRIQLRIHAQDALKSADAVLESASKSGFNLPKVSRLVEGAKRAFQEGKFFLASELIARCREETNKVKPMASFGYHGENGTYQDPIEDTMVCHRCGERIAKDNTLCPGCGTHLDSSVCPNCRSLVPQGFLFCGNCGVHMDNVCEVCGAINDQHSRSCGICGGELMKTLEVEDEELDVVLIPRD